MDSPRTSAFPATASPGNASAPPHAASRRRFLTMLATGAAASAAPALPSTASPVVDAEATPARGYRHTEHVGKYYATARL